MTRHVSLPWAIRRPFASNSLPSAVDSRVPVWTAQPSQRTGCTDGVQSTRASSPRPEARAARAEVNDVARCASVETPLKIEFKLNSSPSAFGWSPRPVPASSKRVPTRPITVVASKLHGTRRRAHSYDGLAPRSAAVGSALAASGRSPPVLQRCRILSSPHRPRTPRPITPRSPTTKALSQAQKGIVRRRHSP
jgi:hypothetical protein